MLSWKTISLFGNNKLINKSYVYLFFVPIAAKFLSKLKSPLEFKINDIVYSFVFDLPFNWQLFYYSAISFTIGVIIYNFRAPLIIRENRSFGSFLDERKNLAHVVTYRNEIGVNEKWLESIGLSKKSVEVDAEYRDVISNISRYGTSEKEQTKITDKLSLYRYVNSNFLANNKDDSEIAKKFWAVFNYAKTTRYFWLILAHLFYGLGFALISTVIIQGVLVVFMEFTLA